MELYPFVKQRNIKTLIVPITRKRLAEAYEKERLENEKKILKRFTKSMIRKNIQHLQLDTEKNSEEGFFP